MIFLLFSLSYFFFFLSSRGNERRKRIKAFFQRGKARVGERVTGRRRRRRRHERKGDESTDESEETEEKGGRTVDGEPGWMGV